MNKMEVANISPETKKVPSPEEISEATASLQGLLAQMNEIGKKYKAVFDYAEGGRGQDERPNLNLAYESIISALGKIEEAQTKSRQSERLNEAV